MKRYGCVAIVGVGLIGGSIGLALRSRRLVERVVGIGRRRSSLEVARRVGAATETTVSLAKGVREAELVVVCSPVGKIVDHVLEAAQHAPEGTLLTDAGSTKRAIVAALDGRIRRGCGFLGSHPLAGSEKAGPAHARDDLFEGRLTILTPTKRTPAEDIDRLIRFWSSLGSTVVQMTAAEHDRALALTSHLPHAVAVALAAALPEKWARLAGSGFLDTSRLAAGSPELWKDILSGNHRNVAAALGQFERRIAALRSAVEQEDERRLERILTRAKKKRDALGS